MTSELLIYILVLGVAGYALGRLITTDTVLDPIRSPVLRLVGGPKLPAIEEFERYGYDVVSSELVWPVNPVRRYLLDGLTCPSCVGWWCILAMHLGLDVVPQPWRVDILVLFASWGLCGALVRKVG